jgi:hypothetical protein
VSLQASYLAHFTSTAIFSFVGDNHPRTVNSQQLEIYYDYLIGTWSSQFYLATAIIKLFDYYNVSKQFYCELAAIVDFQVDYLTEAACQTRHAPKQDYLYFLKRSVSFV